jgi:hypothetical protein
MRARLKKLTSDTIEDLEGFVPPQPDEFAVPLILEVGPLGLRGRERFHLLVVTPRWLQVRHGEEGQVLGRGKLIVFGWSYERIKAFLTRKVEGCEAETWPDLVKQVARIAEWEGGDPGSVVALR